MNRKHLNLAINFGVYFLLILSVYWGGLLALFSFWEFYKSFRISPNFFEAVYGLIGLVAWLNAWYYYKKIRKHDAGTLWQIFYDREKPKFYFTIIGVALFVILFKLSQSSLQVSGILGTILQIVSMPWAFGDSVMFRIDLNIRRYVPMLSPINNLGWILSLIFEIVLFYYLARIAFWRPGRKKFGLEKKQ